MKLQLKASTCEQPGTGLLAAAPTSHQLPPQAQRPQPISQHRSQPHIHSHTKRATSCQVSAMVRRAQRGQTPPALSFSGNWFATGRKKTPKFLLNAHCRDEHFPPSVLEDFLVGSEVFFWLKKAPRAFATLLSPFCLHSHTGRALQLDEAGLSALHLDHSASQREVQVPLGWSCRCVKSQKYTIWFSVPNCRNTSRCGKALPPQQGWLEIRVRSRPSTAHQQNSYSRAGTHSRGGSDPFCYCILPASAARLHSVGEQILGHTEDLLNQAASLRACIKHPNQSKLKWPREMSGIYSSNSLLPWQNLQFRMTDDNKEKHVQPTYS